MTTRALLGRRSVPFPVARRKISSAMLQGSPAMATAALRSGLPAVLLPESRRALRHDIRRFLADQLDRGAYRPLVNSWLMGWDPAFSEGLGRRGWIGVALPADYGSDQASALTRLVVAEELWPQVRRSQRTRLPTGKSHRCPPALEMQPCALDDVTKDVRAVREGSRPRWPVARQRALQVPAAGR